MGNNPQEPINVGVIQNLTTEQITYTIHKKDKEPIKVNVEINSMSFKGLDNLDINTVQSLVI